MMQSKLRSTGSVVRRGFTLVEMVTAIAVFSIIALSLQSVLLLATKAIPDSKGVGASQLAGSRATDAITAELTYALSLTELGANAITFTVADRNSDGAPETIRYAWSGVAGDPLTRSYNGGAATNVLDDVREFALTYDKRSVRNPATYTESAETLLFSYTGSLLTNAWVTDNNDWCGQYFVPTLPNGISSWRITHVRFLTRNHSSSSGENRVQIRTANASGLPTNVVVDQAKVMESTLPSSWTWFDSYFTNAGGLSPTSGMCVVFRWVSDSESGDIQWQTLSLALGGGAKMVTTGNSGSSWSSSLLGAIPIYVYGTSSTQNPDTYSYYLSDVRLVVRSGADVSARINSSALVLSQPQVTGP